MPAVAPTPRIVVTDDSSLMRRVLADGLDRLGLAVVGQARTGEEALELCERLRPDVLTLDLAMPGLDGLGVLHELRSRRSAVPVVVVSSCTNGARAIEALSEGAIELVAKPSGGGSLSVFLTDLADTLRIAARARPAKAPAAPARSNGAAPAAPPRPAVSSRTRRAVVVACSTGGPKALTELVPRLPARVGEGLLIVQHMPAGFTASLAERLDRASLLRVREAEDGVSPDPATAYLAPGGSHLRLDGDRTLRLSDDEPIGGLRPRADLTIADAARVFGERLLLVVLTGMGKDGLDGAREVKRRGGRVVAEAESTCVVYGMPRAVVEAGLADVVAPLPELADAVVGEAGR